MLTQDEIKMISQIVTDIESGNHLLYPRSEEYKNFWNEVAVARKENITPRQKEINKAFNECYKS